MSVEPRAKHTPSCFTATLEVAGEIENVRVVHGWIFMDSKWILHAWCEVDEKIFDLTLSREPLMKKDYYTRMGVTDARKKCYSRLEFFTLSGDAGHFGPFDETLFFAKESATDPLIRMERQDF